MPARKKIQTPPADRLLTTQQAADYAGLSTRSLHRLADQGLVTKYFYGSRLRWDTDELDSLVSRRRPESVERSVSAMRSRLSVGGDAA